MNVKLCHCLRVDIVKLDTFTDSVNLCISNCLEDPSV